MVQPLRRKSSTLSGTVQEPLMFDHLPLVEFLRDGYSPDPNAEVSSTPRFLSGEFPADRSTCKESRYIVETIASGAVIPEFVL